MLQIVAGIQNNRRAALKFANIDAPFKWRNLQNRAPDTFCFGLEPNVASGL